jgi:hypothetical protein
MVLKRFSHIVLIGIVTDDIIMRIRYRAVKTLCHFIMVREEDFLAVSWNDVLEPADYAFLVEDITSIFESVNIPA